jgi:hypothetical protein
VKLNNVREMNKRSLKSEKKLTKGEMYDWYDLIKFIEFKKHRILLFLTHSINLIIEKLNTRK